MSAPRKSSFSNPSGNSALVSVMSPDLAGGLIVIKSDHPVWGKVFDGCALTPDEWRAFVAGVKAGEFDLDERGLLPQVQT